MKKIKNQHHTSTPPFLDITKELVFETFFKGDLELTQSLLQAFLPLPSGSIIEQVDIVDSKLTSDRFQNQKVLDKTYILDLKVKLRRKDKKNILLPSETVNVEMQTTRQKGFTHRMLAYAGRLYSQQLKQGESHDKLAPVYSLLFTTQGLEEFEKIEDQYYHICRFQRAESPYVVLTSGIQFVVVELNKFLKTETRELINERELWSYFLKNSIYMGVKDVSEF